MVGDILCAIMPMFLIWKLTRSVAERRLISFLMALILFATATGVLKIIYTKTIDRTLPDAVREMMRVFFWVRVEESILVVASSTQLIKSPVVHALHRLGPSRFRSTIGELNSFHSSNFGAADHCYSLSNRQVSYEKPVGG